MDSGPKLGQLIDDGDRRRDAIHIAVAPVTAAEHLRDSFLQALTDNEDDVTTRMVYADWLDDHGEHEEADRQRQWPIEKLLTAGAVGSIDDWRGVKDYLAQSFAQYLGQAVISVWEPIYEDISPNWGFSFGIRSAGAFAGPLAVEWYGVISHGHGHTEAIVLLFAQDQRAIHVEGNEYLYFEFAATPEGGRRWESRGWRTSEMGEWDGYRRLTEVVQNMRRKSQSESEPNTATDRPPD